MVPAGNIPAGLFFAMEGTENGPATRKIGRRNSETREAKSTLIDSLAGAAPQSADAAISST
jgi:hypothetical protein